MRERDAARAEKAERLRRDEQTVRPRAVHPHVLGERVVLRGPHVHGVGPAGEVAGQERVHHGFGHRQEGRDVGGVGLGVVCRLDVRVERDGLEPVAGFGEERLVPGLAARAPAPDRVRPDGGHAGLGELGLDGGDPAARLPRVGTRVGVGRDVVVAGVAGPGGEVQLVAQLDVADGDPDPRRLAEHGELALDAAGVVGRRRVALGPLGQQVEHEDGLGTGPLQLRLERLEGVARRVESLVAVRELARLRGRLPEAVADEVALADAADEVGPLPVPVVRDGAAGEADRARAEGPERRVVGGVVAGESADRPVDVDPNVDRQDRTRRPTRNSPPTARRGLERQREMIEKQGAVASAAAPGEKLRGDDVAGAEGDRPAQGDDDVDVALDADLVEDVACEAQLKERPAPVGGGPHANREAVGARRCARRDRERGAIVGGVEGDRESVGGRRVVDPVVACGGDRELGASRHGRCGEQRAEGDQARTHRAREGRATGSPSPRPGPWGPGSDWMREASGLALDRTAVQNARRPPRRAGAGGARRERVDRRAGERAGATCR